MKNIKTSSSSALTAKLNEEAGKVYNINRREVNQILKELRRRGAIAFVTGKITEDEARAAGKYFDKIDIYVNGKITK